MIGGEVPIMYLVNHCRFLYTYEGKGFFLIFVSTCVDYCLPYDHPASDWNPGRPSRARAPTFHPPHQDAAETTPVDGQA
eukprot:COSAG01_NODE_1007_length_12161_cov_12.669624_9_plen_79_part_00